MILSGNFLELIVKCLKYVRWDTRFFSNYHSGEYDSLKGDDLPGMKPLQKFDDIAEIGRNKHSIYLFSEKLLKNHLFRDVETNRFTLSIKKNRLTFRIRADYTMISDVDVNSGNKIGSEEVIYILQIITKIR